MPKGDSTPTSVLPTPASTRHYTRTRTRTRTRTHRLHRVHTDTPTFEHLHCMCDSACRLKATAHHCNHALRRVPRFVHVGVAVRVGRDRTRRARCSLLARATPPRREAPQLA